MRTSRAVDVDDGALRSAAVLLAGLTVVATGLTYGAARLSAGRILRPIAELTAAAEHVTQTRDLTTRLDSTGTNDEVGRLGSSFDSRPVTLLSCRPSGRAGSGAAAMSLTSLCEVRGSRKRRASRLAYIVRRPWPPRGGSGP